MVISNKDPARFYNFINIFHIRYITRAGKRISKGSTPQNVDITNIIFQTDRVVTSKFEKIFIKKFVGITPIQKFIIDQINPSQKVRQVIT